MTDLGIIKGSNCKGIGFGEIIELNVFIRRSFQFTRNFQGPYTVFPFALCFNVRRIASNLFSNRTWDEISLFHGLYIVCCIWLGKSYPDTDPIAVKLGQVVKLRLWNKDVTTAEKMDHPIHIHGTGFQIVSLNGSKPEREIWKDTVNVPAGEYVDIAFTMTNPGTWMLHCHILDHEDGGMMTSIVAK